MHHTLPARREAQPTGVIETLSAGFSAVNRHLWVLLLPILLDVFLWLGPHVSYSPLVGPLAINATEWTRQVALGPRRPTRNPELSGALDQTRQWVIARSDEVNGLEALTWGPLGLPNVNASQGGGDELAFVTNWAEGLTLLAASVLLGLVLGGWFYAGLAGASTGVRAGPLEAGRGTPRAVVDVVVLVLVLFGVALLLGLPVVLLIAFTAFVSPPIAILGGVLLAVGVLFAVVHLFFAVSAIFVSRAGPLRAIQRSVGLVRRNLRPTVALVALTWLILAGMGRAWEALASGLRPPYGVGLGIVGNAYIASGLIAAAMIFYSQRTESATQGSAAQPG